jgi:hypothetical protein
MRHLLLVTASLLAFATVPSFAGDDTVKPKIGAEAGKVVNTIDPLSGLPVSADAGTLELSYEHHEKKHTVLVGFSSKESKAKAEAADHKLKSLIAHAANTHRIIKDGKLEKIEEKK